MKKILISGLVTVETNLLIEAFPLQYYPMGYPFFGVNTSVSGVAFNQASALKTLGNKVEIISLTGRDLAGDIVKKEMKSKNLSVEYLSESASATSQSVILFDKSGKRQGHCDLKDLQELEYDLDYTKVLKDCDVFVSCNINFSRKIGKAARAAGKLIATDVHNISDVYDGYNKEFLENADILFLSHELIGEDARDFVTKLANAYRSKIIVVGTGEKGALLWTRENREFVFVEAVYTRKVINTIGAGDALFSAFLHNYIHSGDAYNSLKRAVVFASYKIGENGGATGFLTENELNQWCGKIYG